MIGNYFRIRTSITPHPAVPLRAIQISIKPAAHTSNPQIRFLDPLTTNHKNHQPQPLVSSTMSHSTGSSKFDSIPYHDKLYPAIDPTQYSSTTFTNKVVLITGSGRGIGKELGLAFSSLGAKVCFTDLTL